MPDMSKAIEFLALQKDSFEGKFSLPELSQMTVNEMENIVERNDEEEMIELTLFKFSCNNDLFLFLKKCRTDMQLQLNAEVEPNV